MAAYFLTPTPERIRVMDFTTAIYLTDYVFLVPYPEQDNELSHLTASLKPFSTPVNIADEFDTLTAYSLHLIVFTLRCRPG